jgi:hypothetical protein
MIFNANRQAIGANPTNLPPGLELILPCEDGRLTADSALGAAEAHAEEDHAEMHQENKNYDPAFKFVTANDWKPFTDESLSGGGIYVKMATTALHRGGNEHEFKVGFVDDWGSHIDVLLPTKAFDVSIAWSMPDCSKIDMLGEFAVKMCTEFMFSDPIYEVAYSYFPLPLSPALPYPCHVQRGAVHDPGQGLQRRESGGAGAGPVGSCHGAALAAGGAEPLLVGRQPRGARQGRRPRGSP